MAFKGGKGSVGGSMTFETKFDPLPTKADIQALATEAMRAGVAGKGIPRKERQPRKPRAARKPQALQPRA